MFVCEEKRDLCGTCRSCAPCRTVRGCFCFPWRRSERRQDARRLFPLGPRWPDLKSVRIPAALPGGSSGASGIAAFQTDAGNRWRGAYVCGAAWNGLVPNSGPGIFRFSAGLCRETADRLGGFRAMTQNAGERCGSRKGNGSLPARFSGGGEHLVRGSGTKVFLLIKHQICERNM